MPLSYLRGALVSNPLKAHRLNLSAKIKNRNVSSGFNAKKTNNEFQSPVKRGKKSKFKSLLIEKDFEPENPKQL